MIRRPKATDTEEDLLSLQESFLASGELPSASLYSQRAAPSNKSKAQVGEKRDHGEDMDMSVAGTFPGRDIVKLHPEGGASHLESGKPPVKRSRFKEARERAKAQEAPDDPFAEMEYQDTHITKVLADIQEHEGFSASSIAMPTRMTKAGFPMVHQLDLSSLSSLPDVPGQSQSTSSALTGRGGRGVGIGGVTKPPKKKKSLFAQQLEKHGLEYFGIEVSEAPEATSQTAFQKDYVEPVSLGGELIKGRERERINRPDSEGVATIAADAQDIEVGDGGGGVARMDFESDASQAWKGFLESSFISGEGLVSVGVPSDAAKEEVAKIHQENVERLSGFSEEEILKEKERIQQTLGPEMIAFLKKRREQKMKSSPEDEEREKMDVTEHIPTTKKSVEETSDQDTMTSDKERTDDNNSLERSRPGRWLHMDVVEKDKMEWMTDIPLYQQDSSDEERPREVRFSLDGLVIHKNVVLPPHLGLHHHGDEPQAAGYTLTELLPLCRSTVLQQRVLALNVLARITQRARQSEYVGLIQGSVVGKLLEAGVPLLLRYALDDSNAAVIYVAVHCLHSLLVLTPEEHLLDDYFHCYHGYSLPSLRSPDRPPRSHDNQSGNDEEDKETDIEILQRDVVEGLLNMQLLHRLRYIIEVCRPPSLTVTKILQVLIRVARHSLSAASQVVNCPRLMKVIFDEFLPLSWSWDAREEEDGREEGGGRQEVDTKDEVAHGRPQVAAVKLLFTVCSAGRNLTSQLASQYQLLSVITRYTVLHPTELSLPRKTAYELAIISLQTWTVALSYAIGDTAFRDTYPVFLRQLHQLSSLSNGGPHSLGQLESKRISALLGLIQVAIRVAAVTPDQLKTDKQNVTLSPPAIEWSHATGMLTPLLQCLTLWVEQTLTGATQIDRMLCVASLLHCVATYYASVFKKSAGDSLEVLDQIEKLVGGVLSKLTKSALLSYALEAMRKISALSNVSSESVPPSPLSLPSHLHLLPPPKRPLYNQPIMVQNDFAEMLQPRVVCLCCSNLLLGYIRLCLVTSQRHKGVISKVVQIFQNAVFMDYLEGVVQNTKIMCSSFNFVELSLLYHTVKLFTAWLELSEKGSVHESMALLFHHLAFKLLSLLPPGMECYITDLISTTMFNRAMFRDCSSLQVEQDITVLSLHDSPHPITTRSLTTAGQPSAPSSLLSQTMDSLGSLSSLYLKALQTGGQCTQKQVDNSKWILDLEPVKVSKLILPSYSGACLPLDWLLLPLIQEYNRAVSPKKRDHVVTEDSVAMVTHTLRLLLMLEHLRPKLLRELPTSAKIVRLMCVFLIGNDLFLESEVHSCLVALLRIYCQEHVQLSVDFTASLPGLVSFDDLYSSLLEQFTAVSYGDHLFACFVLLPLQQRFSMHLRKIVWKDNPTVIRILSLPIAEVPVNLKNFLYPIENDESLLEAYLSAIATGIVKSSWSPLFYLIAVHHLHSVIFSSGGKELNASLQSKLLQGVLKLKDEDPRRHLLMYNGVDEKTTVGFKCSETLTQEQVLIISKLQ